MRSLIAIMLITTVAFQAGLDYARADSAAEARNVELKALESRLKLKTGRVELSMVYARGGTIASAGHDVLRWHYSIVFAGDKIRVEQDFRAADGIVATRVLTDEVCIYDPGTQDEHIHVLSPEKIYASAKDDVFHPNILGVYAIPLTALDNYTVEDALARPDWDDMQVRDEMLDGQKVLVVTSRTKRGAEIKHWIAPDLQYAVLKSQAQDREARALVHSKYRLYPGGVWYPKEVRFEQAKVKDGRVTGEEIVTVESAEFHVAVDPALFTLASFKRLSQGDRLTKDGIEFLWNGAEMVSIPDPNELQVAEFTKPNNRLRILLVINAVACAALAFVFLVRYWRRSQTK